MIRAILKFGASLFVNYVFYDFFRDQLKYRVKDRKRIFLVLLLSAAAFSVVNSFHNGFVNLVFGLSIVTLQVMLIFRDDRRREMFLILVGESVALFMELVVYLFFSKLPLWKPLWEAFRYPQEAEEYMMGILSYLLCWFILHGLKSYFLSTRYTMRERFPLSFFVLPFSTALIYLSLFFESRGETWTEYSLNLGYVLLPIANILMFYTVKLYMKHNFVVCLFLIKQVLQTA